MRTMILGVAASLLCTVTLAQDKAAPELGPEHYAQLRTQAYVAALGLDEEQAADLHRIFLQGENEAAALRAACRQAQEKVAEMMKESDAKAEKVFSEAQKTRLVSIQRTGEFNPEIISCVPVGKAACTKGFDANGRYLGSGKPKTTKATLAPAQQQELVAPSE